MNNDTTFRIDLEQIAARRKHEWMREARKFISIQERIALSVPWWLIIIATGLFALSAGHTAGVFLELSSVGYAGPFVVEFALLWAAFARVNATGKVSLALRILEVLAFIIAIFVNGIGATTRVAAIAGIGQFSFSAITAQFGALPLATQAILLFVPLFALFIPIGTWVAGEGLADLFLKQRKTGGLLEEKWRDVEAEELRRALYAELIRRGLPNVDAKRTASAMSASLTRGQGHIGQIPSIVDVQRTPPLDSGMSANGHGKHRTADASERVREHLKAHPEDITAPARRLAKQLDVGHSTVHKIQVEFGRGSDSGQ